MELLEGVSLVCVDGRVGAMEACLYEYCLREGSGLKKVERRSIIDVENINQETNSNTAHEITILKAFDFMLTDLTTTATRVKAQGVGQC